MRTPVEYITSTTALSRGVSLAATKLPISATVSTRGTRTGSFRCASKSVGSCDVMSARRRNLENARIPPTWKRMEFAVTPFARS